MPVTMPEPESAATRRRLARALAVVVVAFAALLAAAGIASAHADLVSSSPANGSVLANEPSELTLTYSEAVTLDLSSVSVVAPDGRHVNSGSLHYGAAGNESLSIALAPDASQGTYVVDWQATASDDGHATAGFVTFSVGTKSRFTAPSQAAAHDSLTNSIVDVAIWLGFAGLALLVGDAAVRRLCVAQNREIAQARQRRWLPVLGWGATLIATLIQLALAGPYARGEAPTRAFNRTLLSATLSTNEGHALMARLIVLAVVAVFGDAAVRARAGSHTATATLTVLALALAATWSATSHAASGSLVPLAFAVTTVHVASMAVWAGGLTSMTLLLKRSPGAVLQAGPTADLAGVSSRFSRLALTAVTALVASGLYQAWREVGTFGALTGTTYGRLLLIKVAIVAAVLCVAARSRSLVARRRTRSPGNLRTSIMIELIGVATVLVVTVLLIGNAPARR